MKTFKLATLYFLLYLLFACQQKEDNSIIELSIIREGGFDELKLSEIAEDIKAIELEVTDSSLIAYQGGQKVFPLDEYIVFCEGIIAKEQILLFDKRGKFIRRIGTKGQGPGEYIAINTATVNEKEQHIYIASHAEIMCFDFQGKVIFERKAERNLEEICLYKDGILGISTSLDVDGYNRTVCYKMDKELHPLDSLIVQEEERKTGDIIMPIGFGDIFSIMDKNVYFHRAKLVSKVLSCDTLFEMRNNNLIPSVRVTTKEDITYLLRNIFRSSRFIFVGYCFYPLYYFCYDTKTGKGYNMDGGYTDDIYTGEKVKIRPFPNDSERFYYLHTNMKETDKNEPNPTLYIGRFKK